MDLNELKSKFRHKTRADLKDLDLVLDAVPFLVRELEKMEAKTQESEKRIEHLSSLMKKRPPLDKKGKKGDLSWQTRVDEDKNRLYIKISGKIDYSSAKLASNSVITILPNLRGKFDVINDLSGVEPGYNRKDLFHFKKMIFSLKELGIRKIINIKNEKAPGVSVIFENKSKTEDFQSSSSDSVEDAEAMLDNVATFLKT